MTVKRKLIFLMIGGVFLLPILACGSVGVYDPQATQVALQGTVGALQATITALETGSATSVQPPGQSSPQIVVVTATPTPQALRRTATPISNPTAPVTSTFIASSAGLSQGETIALSLTPTPTPTVVPNITVVVATSTATPRPKTYSDPPILIEPPAGLVIEEGREVLLHWSWNGLLGHNEHFDIKIRPDGQDRSAYVAWEDGEVHDWRANLTPGRYFWSVQIVKGYYENDSGAPEDRVFETFLSPESELRLIIVAEKEKPKTPTPTPTKSPDPSPTPISSPTP